MHAHRPPHVHLDLVGDDHEAVPGVLVEHPVDRDRVAPGDDVAVVVGETDFGAVEASGALGPALGVLAHRLGAQLERMGAVGSLGRFERPVVVGRLFLHPIERVEQRRPGGGVGVGRVGFPGARSEAGPGLVGIAVEPVVVVIVVVIVVVEGVPGVDRERVVARRIGSVDRFGAGVDEVPVVPDEVGAVPGGEAEGERDRSTAPCALSERVRIGARRLARSVVRHRSGPSM